VQLFALEGFEGLEVMDMSSDGKHFVIARPVARRGPDEWREPIVIQHWLASIRDRLPTPRK
jgi:hypothetical protein